MIAFCCTERRRVEISRHPSLLGLDYLEVSADQTSLLLYFIPPGPGLAKAAIPPALNIKNIVISGGERVTNIKPVSLSYATDHIIVVVSDGRPPGSGVGDFSSYELQLIDVPNLDPAASEVTFSFKVQCPSDFDCRTVASPQPALDRRSPQLNYLAKDYASFRQLILDRLATLTPQWRDRQAADIGMTLVELMAYVADHLSYRQDAIATEAYLGTARRRISVKRHARLVDYAMHEGQNSRVWVMLQVDEDDVPVKAGSQLLSKMDGHPTIVSHTGSALDSLLATAQPIVFEVCHDAVLFKSHTAMRFYDWGNEHCHLPIGSTSATLLGHYPNLKAGHVLVFEQLVDPATEITADANPQFRHAVLLTQVIAHDVNHAPLSDALTGQLITEITWSRGDALPWNMCITVPSKLTNETIYVSVAHGNILLADHGRTISSPELLKDGEQSEVPTARPVDYFRDGHGGVSVGTRYRPSLSAGPLTYALPVQPIDAWTSASEIMRSNPSTACPAISLTGFETRDKQRWFAVNDLLSSSAEDRHFVVEVETQVASDSASNDSTVATFSQAILRFGDGYHGKLPHAGTRFEAIYRVGNGQSGNMGADQLRHIVSNDRRVVAVRNPLPAVGGTDPESIESARLLAPTTFRRQERAVTPADYAEIALRHGEVQRAAATFRWTGSWITVFLSIDRHGGRPLDESFRREMLAHFETYRMAGVDLHISAPRFVPLEVELHVCVLPGYLREHVKLGLLEALGSRSIANGLGFFHPDNFTFGMPVYASRLIARARAVAGVENVVLRKFQRLLEPNVKGLDSGQLPLGSLEIARLDNDPNFPENGKLKIEIGGGR